MWSDLLVRFAIGGIVVSTFALIGDLFKPKSFAGLFSAAPSIALATLWLAFEKHGADYAALQGRPMTVGAMALYLYSQVVCIVLLRHKLSSVLVSGAALIVWFGVAFLGWFIFLR